MIEERIDCAGLDTIAIGPRTARTVVVILHGRNMRAADLAPFAHALGVEARFLFPDAPVDLGPAGRAWWPVDAELDAQRAIRGPADLFGFDPPGRVAARARLQALREGIAADQRVVLAGFSQGGMLAMDAVLHGCRVDALALISSTRIAFADWRPRLAFLHGLPMLVAHGRADAELSLAAGEALRDAAMAGGAQVTWLAHEGGHEIPLPVWRALRRLIQQSDARFA